MSDAFDLTGKVVIVTGGSRGLGRAMVEAFATRGADVVIASRKLPACQELAEQVVGTTSRRALPVAFHAGVWDDAERLLDTTYEEFGRCDVVVNNAGMSPLYKKLTDVTEELFDKVIGVNLRGPFRLSTMAAERMAAGDGGSIINVTSVAAVQPTAHELVYAAAKSALNTLTVGLARAYGPQVRCNAIMAGPFLTDISEHWDMEAFDKYAERSIPLRRAGQPGEVVGAALYLASPASSYTSGAVLKVDGGMAFSPA
jgi:NAD(P)-dependent dehydrogenase (short-subunit alcohol dehydrogenase family)